VKVEGTYIISAPRETVWQHLMSPDSLARSIPGCEKLVPNSDGSYDAELKISISAIKGAYQGRVEILDTLAPERYRIKVEGQGMGGFVRGEGTLALADDGPAATKITYLGDAQVGGILANVGQRLILAATRQMANHFFRQLSEQIQPSPIGQPMDEGARATAAPPQSAEPTFDAGASLPATSQDGKSTSGQSASTSDLTPPESV